MKKIVTAVIAGLIVISVQADVTVYSEDFSSVTIALDPVTDGGLVYYPADFSAGEYATIAGVASVNASDQLVLKPNANGGARAVTTVVDSSDFVGVGTYTLSFDYVDAFNFTELDVQIWNAKDAAIGNGFYVDVVTAQGADAVVSKWAASTVTLTALSLNNEYPNGVLEGTTQTIDFTYDGTGDIVLAFTAIDTRAAGGFQQQLVLDNVNITTTIPEPATFGLVGAVGGAMLFIRRKFTV